MRLGSVAAQRLPLFQMASSRPSLHRARCLVPGSALPKPRPRLDSRGKKHKARSAAEAAKKEEGVYRSTVQLPKTQFDLRANSQKREPQLQKFWAEEGIYETLFEERGDRETFTLHDGPPYANGDLHIGHAMNKILKDIINRYQTLRGKRVKFVPGWDCHGLPIELKVVQSLKSAERKALTPLTLRQKAREFALQTVDKQRDSFKRYGVWADWEAPYLTLQPEYEAAQIGVFGDMFIKGYIYRGLKPVHWSPSSKTALAEAELEYPDGHVSQSIYVSLPLLMDQVASERLEQLPAKIRELGARASLAIWTTTPWTIPANAAVAVNADLEYSLVRIAKADDAEEAQPGPDLDCEYLIVATELVETLAAKLALGLEEEERFKGSALEGLIYHHPLMDRSSPVVIGGDYITTESGTGLVHTAPGHGQEDFQVGKRNGLPTYAPVDDNGRFTADAGEGFEGLNVLGDGNVRVIDELREKRCLLKQDPYQHKYPYDWRTKKPVIFRATEQWFASVDGFKDQALDTITKVQWIPAAGEKRITAMAESRSDWCISRQRAWGVPIPVFYFKDSREPLITEASILHIQDVIRNHPGGSDAWWELPIEDLLPEELRSQADQLERGTDTMDVWFDSGSSWAAVCSQRAGLKWPADLYLEGSDQHRGWFQSSLLTTVATKGCAPYSTVLTHGFVLDERGNKMSKSLGNVIDPGYVINGGNDKKKQPAYGADVLRLWVSSVDYTSDVPIGDTIIRQASDIYRKIRGTLRFLLGNVHDFRQAEHGVAYDELPRVDKLILFKLAALIEEVSQAYDTFQFSRVFSAVQRFVVLDLSQFYFDIGKDRLYIKAADSFSRRSCQTTLLIILDALQTIIAPILPHMAEDAFQNSSMKSSALKSVFAKSWPAASPQWQAGVSREEAALWQDLFALRDAVNKLLETARGDKAIGSSLDAQIVLVVDNESALSALQAFNGGDPDAVDELRYLFLVSQVTLSTDASLLEGCAYTADAAIGTDEEGESGGGGLPGGIRLGAKAAAGKKCERCWNYSPRVGEDGEYATLCERCVPVVRALDGDGTIAAAAAAAAVPTSV